MQAPFQVATVAATELPQRTAYLAMHTDYSEDYVVDTPLDEAKCGEICVSRLLAGDRGHYGPLEHPQISLAILADHNTMMQLRTHRHITCDFQSLRYTGARVVDVAEGKRLVEEVFYVRPPGNYRDRQGEVVAWTDDDVEEHLAICLSSAHDYKRLRDRGVPEEQARQVLVTTYFQCGLVSGSLRSWLHILDMRLKPNAQYEIRQLMEMTLAQIKRWAPEVTGWWVNHRCGKARLAP